MKEDQRSGGPGPAGRYSKRRLSYATTFDSPLRAMAIRAVEWLTGKLTLLRLIRRFEKQGAPHGQAFWAAALAHMGIPLCTPAQQIARIPKSGPVVVVANHPHGLVDGMVLAALIGRIRTDYRILARTLLTGVEEVADFMIPVPFQHVEDARAQNLQMRRQAMAHLRAGGVVVLFPAGGVATSRTAFGPVIEAEWSPFTAKLIQRSAATVVPIYFPGQNSRWYHIANRISPILRQGLLIHEVVHSLDTPQAPIVGRAIPPEESRKWDGDSRGYMRWLRARTLALGAEELLDPARTAHGPGQRVGIGVSPE